MPVSHLQLLCSDQEKPILQLVMFLDQSFLELVRAFHSLSIQCLINNRYKNIYRGACLPVQLQHLALTMIIF